MHTQTGTQTCPRPVVHGTHVWRETGGKRKTYTCPGAQGRAPSSSVRLRPDAFTRDALEQYGWESPTAAAKAMGLHSSTLRRTIAGSIAPGERLIAALIVGTGHSFDALFTIVAETRMETPLPYTGDETDDGPETVVPTG